MSVFPEQDNDRQISDYLKAKRVRQVLNSRRAVKLRKRGEDVRYYGREWGYLWVPKPLGIIKPKT